MGGAREVAGGRTFQAEDGLVMGGGGGGGTPTGLGPAWLEQRDGGRGKWALEGLSRWGVPAKERVA